jgi:ABC-type antimicrobial peptide transport system permease subunit
MGLLSGFAIAAMILACVGIYGVISYSVAQRVIEVGIRMAFGATRKQISFLFIRRTFSAALIGVLAGGIAAFFAARLLRSQLYGVPPDHLLTFLASAVVLLIPALVASVVPAIRAAAIDPSVALRRE